MVDYNVQIRRRNRGGQDADAPDYKLRVKALTNFWAFVDLIGFHGGSHQFSKCHRDLLNWSLGDANTRQLILMPRGHYKSTLMAVARTLWRIYQNPNIRIFLGSGDFSLSKSLIREIKTYLEDDYLQDNVWNNRPHKQGRLVPLMDKAGRARRQSLDTEASDKKIVWRADAIQVIRDDILKEPTVVAGSVGATATGFHYDEVIFDDVVNFDNIDTPSKRDRLFQWIYDIESVLDPMTFDEDLFNLYCQIDTAPFTKGLFKKACYLGDTVRVIGTRYDPQDYYQHVLDNATELAFSTYECNIYVNGKDSDDGYIFPEKFNEALEQRLRASMSQRRFASQYLNQIIESGSQILPWSKIKWLTSDEIVCKQANKASIRRNGVVKEINLKAVVDPATTTEEYSDYTCMAVGGVDDEGNFYVVDLWMGKEVFSVWVEKMFALLDRWNLTAVTVETVAFQKQLVYSIRQFFAKFRPVTIREWKPPARQDKMSRIESVLQPVFFNEMVYFKWTISQKKGVADQFNLFGRSTVKDDAPDAVAILKQVSVSPNTKMKAFNPSKRNFNNKYGGML